MKLKILFLCVTFIICFSFIGCGVSKNLLSKPDKILIYNEGNIKELDNTSPQFSKIVELTNTRFNNKISTALDIINDKEMEYIHEDGLGIEFFYNKEQSLSVKGDGFIPFKYNRLYFQLTSNKYGTSQGSPVYTLQYGDKDNYKDCSRGPLVYSKELVKLVEGLK